MLNTDNEGLLSFYKEADEFFERIIPRKESTVVQEADALMEEARQIILDPSPDNVVLYQAKLASILASLGEITAEAESELVAMKSYLEECYADEFTDSKEILEATKPRVLKAEVETAIAKRHRKDERLAKMLDVRVRRYKAKLQGGGRIVEALQNRIIQFRRERERSNL